MTDYDKTQLNILIGQAFNCATDILIERDQGQVIDDDELVELTKQLAKDILRARQEFIGEMPDAKIIEAIKGVNKENPQITFEITDYEQASEPQKTLINELKLMLNRLNNPERRPKGTHEEFKEQAIEHSLKVGK